MLIEFELARLTKQGSLANVWLNPELVILVREGDRHLRGQWVAVATITLADGTKCLVRDTHPDNPEERHVARRIVNDLADTPLE